MTTRSMTETNKHLADAAMHVVHVTAHINAARESDPDPEIADQVYLPILNNLKLMGLYIAGRVMAGQPDIEREATS